MANVPDIGRGQKAGLPEQSIAAYPYNGLSPELPVNAELAERWGKMARIEVAESDYRGMNRGDFLVWLWGLVVE